jgi:2-polyprenyl-6-methoxyphenol hydroxylase-like FAD-dependent oxidoreductase
MTLETRCCIAGGGPAGMMLGLLLARAGIPVVVLEKHADFLRDFRGDTVHPSTLEVLHEIGLLEAFLKRPHSELRQIAGQVGDEVVTIADFSHLPVTCPFVALMPQWDFLDLLAERARTYPAFTLLMRAEVEELIEENGKITGVRATTPEGPLDVKADLVVAADGRSSVVRQSARLAVRRPRRPDRRPVAAPDAALDRHGGGVRLPPRRPRVRDVQPHRVLAMRVRDPEGRLRRGPPRGAGGVPRGDRPDRAIPGGSHRRNQALG